jgi:crooked neck
LHFDLTWLFDCHCRFEEYIDYIFPDEVAMAPNLKILEAAYRWKKQKVDPDEED